MINILIFLFIIISVYLIYIYNYQKDAEAEIMIYIDIVILVIILYYSFIYNPNIKNISNFTTDINNNIKIDLSSNTNIDSSSKKIIYWIVVNNNEKYDNFDLNGISDINYNAVVINIKDLDKYSKLELKYRIDNKFNNIYSIIIKA
jgi:hypothetical protein